LLCSAAAVAGHNWSVFFRFKGGRGAATTFGILAVMAFPALLAGCAVIAIPFYMTRGTMFIRGMRRTTLLFGILMLVVSVLIGIDLASGFLPDLPWISEPSFLAVALPIPLLVLNLLKGSTL
jgi:glycerol-3-phosphate acyltransferase PlsY